MEHADHIPLFSRASPIPSPHCSPRRELQLALLLPPHIRGGPPSADRPPSSQQEPSLERKKFRTKGLKEGQDDVRVFFKEPYNVRGKDRLLCFVSEHTVRTPSPHA